MTEIVSKPDYGTRIAEKDSGGVTELFQNFFDELEQIINDDGSSIFTVATLPTAIRAGQRIYVSDEVGGEVPAFSDSFLNWRRVTDRAIVS